MSLSKVRCETLQIEREEVYTHSLGVAFSQFGHGRHSLEQVRGQLGEVVVAQDPVGRHTEGGIPGTMTLLQ